MGNELSLSQADLLPVGQDALRARLSSGANVNKRMLFNQDVGPLPKGCKCTPLGFAILSRDLTLLDTLIASGADLGKPVGLPTRFDFTPLQLAVSLAFAAAVRLLLDKGADPNAPLLRKRGTTTLPSLQHPITGSNEVSSSSPARRILLRIANSTHMRAGDAALHIAIDCGAEQHGEDYSGILGNHNNMEIIETLVNHFPTDLNRLNGRRRTPLYKACKRHLTMVVTLLSTHPRVDVNVGYPLFAAIKVKNAQLVRILLQAGAGHTCGVSNPEGHTPLSYALRDRTDDGTFHDRAAIVALLVQAGSVVKPDMLLHAKDRKWLEVLSALLQSENTTNTTQSECPRPPTKAPPLPPPMPPPKDGIKAAATAAAGYHQAGSKSKRESSASEVKRLGWGMRSAVRSAAPAGPASSAGDMARRTHSSHSWGLGRWLRGVRQETAAAAAPSPPPRPVQQRNSIISTIRRRSIERTTQSGGDGNTTSDSAGFQRTHESTNATSSNSRGTKEGGGRGKSWIGAGKRSPEGSSRGQGGSCNSLAVRPTTYTKPSRNWTIKLPFPRFPSHPRPGAVLSSMKWNPIMTLFAPILIPLILLEVFISVTIAIGEVLQLMVITLICMAVVIMPFALYGMYWLVRLFSWLVYHMFSRVTTAGWQATEKGNRGLPDPALMQNAILVGCGAEDEVSAGKDPMQRSNLRGNLRSPAPLSLEVTEPDIAIVKDGTAKTVQLTTFLEKCAEQYIPPATLTSSRSSDGHVNFGGGSGCNTPGGVLAATAAQLPSLLWRMSSGMVVLFATVMLTVVVVTYLDVLLEAHLAKRLSEGSLLRSCLRARYEQRFKARDSAFSNAEIRAAMSLFLVALVIRWSTGLSLWHLIGFTAGVWSATLLTGLGVAYWQACAHRSHRWPRGVGGDDGAPVQQRGRDTSRGPTGANEGATGME